MHGGFISFAKRCFPDVIVCVNLFHVVRFLATFPSNQEQYWKGSFPFKASLLEQALALSDDLREAYEAFMEVHGILEVPAYSVQRGMLTDWLDAYTASAHEGTRRCTNTIRHYRSYIQNSWKYGRSNRPCEGLNNKIKILKRNCYDVHDFDHFQRRVLFCCGGTKFVRETYTAALELAFSRKEVR